MFFVFMKDYPDLRDGRKKRKSEGKNAFVKIKKKTQKNNQIDLCRMPNGFRKYQLIEL